LPSSLLPERTCWQRIIYSIINNISFLLLLSNAGETEPKERRRRIKESITSPT